MSFQNSFRGFRKRRTRRFLVGRFLVGRSQLKPSLIFLRTYHTFKFAVDSGHKEVFTYLGAMTTRFDDVIRCKTVSCGPFKVTHPS